MNKETILIALVGLSPAVITETIWALAHEHPREIPDRIIVITTTKGRQELKRVLFENGIWEQFKKDLESSIGIPLQNKLRFGPIGDSILTFRNADCSAELSDIRTREENEEAANFLMEKLHLFTENENCRVIASIAGGRKTMSALLHSVMSLLGRAQDRITHVLMAPPWEYMEDFYYPGCPGEFRDPESGELMDSRQSKVELAELPFIPIRYLFNDSRKLSSNNYLQLMNELRQRMLDIDEELNLTLDAIEGKIWINDKLIETTDKEFCFWFYFADRAHQGKVPLQAYADLSEETWKAFAESYKQENHFHHWTHTIADSEYEPKVDCRKLASNLRKKLKESEFDNLSIEKLLPCRGQIGLNLPPEKITIHS